LKSPEKKARSQPGDEKKSEIKGSYVAGTDVRIGDSSDGVVGGILTKHPSPREKGSTGVITEEWGKRELLRSGTSTSP